MIKSTITKSDIKALNDSFGFKGQSFLQIERDYFLNVILYCISLMPISERLVFKGGTALKKVFFSQQIDSYRFSKDLDFSFLGAISESAFNKFLDELCEVTLENTGYRFKRMGSVGVSDYGNGCSGLIRLRDIGFVFENRVDIKFDIRNEPAFNKTFTKREVPNHYAQWFNPGKIMINCETVDGIFSGKSNALFGEYKRTEVRDIFDFTNLYFMYGVSAFSKSLFDYDFHFEESRVETIKRSWDKYFSDMLSKENTPEFDYFMTMFFTVIERVEEWKSNNAKQ